MRKLIVCLTVAIMFSGVSAFGYDNKGGYDNKRPYVQGVYDNTGGYNNEISYHSEFIKGKQRLQKVQTEDGRQAIIPINVPDGDIDKDMKITKGN